MARKNFTVQNNFPLVVTLLVIVFVIPLTVFAVTFQTFFLGAQAQTQKSTPPVKQAKTMLGTVQKKMTAKSAVYFLQTRQNKQYELKTTAAGPSNFGLYVGQNVLVNGWFSLNQDTFYVVSLTPAAK